MVLFIIDCGYNIETEYFQFVFKGYIFVFMYFLR